MHKPVKMTCSSVNLRQFQLLNRQSCNPRVTLLFQQSPARLRKYQTRNNTKIYARTLPSRVSKSGSKPASKEKAEEKGQEEQIVAQLEESHTVTLAGKIATPITELDHNAGRVFWFTVGDTEISNKPGGGIAFLVQVRVPEQVFKDSIHDLEMGDVVIVLGQMQPGQEFLAQQIQKKSGLPQFIDQLPTMKQLYRRPGMMPFKATEESVGEGKENIFNHMLEHQEEWWDMQFQVAPGSRQPHLKHRTLKKKAIWLDDSIPTGLYEQFLKAGRPLLYPGWPLLFEHPEEFWDYEPYKLSSSSPTFIHKATGCGTWFDDTASEDQIAFVNEIRSDSYKGMRPDDPWQNLIEKQSEWIDVRDNKRNPRAPDFRHKIFRNGLALWLDSAPEEIQEFLKTETNLTFAKPRTPQDKSEWWNDLFENQSKWMDNRGKKKAGAAFENYPDFKSVDTTKALWLDSKDTPSWVNDKIEQLQGLIAA